MIINFRKYPDESGIKLSQLPMTKYEILSDDRECDDYIMSLNRVTLQKVEIRFWSIENIVTGKISQKYPWTAYDIRANADLFQSDIIISDVKKMILMIVPLSNEKSKTQKITVCKNSQDEEGSDDRHDDVLKWISWKVFSEYLVC